MQGLLLASLSSASLTGWGLGSLSMQSITTLIHRMIS